MKGKVVVCLSPSATELTTAATDAALALLCLELWRRLRVRPVHKPWQRIVWLWVFGLVVLGSALGVVVHGIELGAWWRAVLWQPLYLSLGLAVALFLVSAMSDWRGPAAGRRLLPWAVATGVVFFGATRLAGGGFLLFVLYETGVMIGALAIYVRLTLSGGLPGAGRVTLGIALTLVAAAVQISPLAVRIIVPLDHNGLFHVVQFVATTVLANGVAMGLDTPIGERIRRPAASRA